MSILRKISAKTVCGKIEVPESEKDLFSLVGIVTGVRTGMSTYGEWVAFTGHFEATNLETGETFTAPQAFIPEPIQSALHERIKNEENPSIELSLIIGVKPSDTATGYEYVTRSLAEMGQHDALAHLRQMQLEYINGKAKEEKPAKAKAKRSAA